MNLKLTWLVSTILLATEFVIASSLCQPFCNIPSGWLNQAKNICYGASGDKYAEFVVKQNCQLFAIRLGYVSGEVKCHTDGIASRWGCSKANGISTLIRNGSSNALFVPEKVADFYGNFILPGFDENDDVLIFKRNAYLKAGEAFQIWYGEDFFNGYEPNNSGRQCIDVDISCLI